LHENSIKYKAKLEYACKVLDVCFEWEIAKLEKVQIKATRIFHDEHNLQVEILFTMKEYGNICLLRVNNASWQHFTKCIIHYVPNIWVIVYILQYKISMITIFATVKTIQHHKANSLNFINSLNISYIINLRNIMVKVPED
jgi:hypothetical protein